MAVLLSGFSLWASLQGHGLNPALWKAASTLWLAAGIGLFTAQEGSFHRLALAGAEFSMARENLSPPRVSPVALRNHQKPFPDSSTPPTSLITIGKLITALKKDLTNSSRWHPDFVLRNIKGEKVYDLLASLLKTVFPEIEIDSANPLDVLKDAVKLFLFRAASEIVFRGINLNDISSSLTGIERSLTDGERGISSLTASPEVLLLTDTIRLNLPKEETHILMKLIQRPRQFRYFKASFEGAWEASQKADAAPPAASTSTRRGAILAGGIGMAVVAALAFGLHPLHAHPEFIPIFHSIAVIPWLQSLLNASVLMVVSGLLGQKEIWDALRIQRSKRWGLLFMTGLFMLDVISHAAPGWSPFVHQLPLASRALVGLIVYLASDSLDQAWNDTQPLAEYWNFAMYRSNLRDAFRQGEWNRLLHLLTHEPWHGLLGRWVLDETRWHWLIYTMQLGILTLLMHAPFLLLVPVIAGIAKEVVAANESEAELKPLNLAHMKWAKPILLAYRWVLTRYIEFNLKRQRFSAARGSIKRLQAVVLPFLRALGDPMSFLLPTAEDWVSRTSWRYQNRKAWMKLVQGMIKMRLYHAVLLLFALMPPHLRQGADEDDTDLYPDLLTVLLHQLSVTQSGRAREGLGRILMNVLMVHPQYSLRAARGLDRHRHPDHLNLDAYKEFYKDVVRKMRTAGVRRPAQRLVHWIQTYRSEWGYAPDRLPLFYEFADKIRDGEEYQTADQWMDVFRDYYVAHGGSAHWKRRVEAWTLVTDPTHPFIQAFLERRQHKIPHTQRAFLLAVRDAWDHPEWLLGEEAEGEPDAGDSGPERAKAAAVGLPLLQRIRQLNLAA